MKDKTLHSLLEKRFGDRYLKNLKKVDHIELDYQNIIKLKPNNKCKECKATETRQDLPFWLGKPKKDFMLIGQDPGKGDEGVEFNTVFSIHQLHLDYYSYIREKKHSKYYHYFSVLFPVENLLEKVYFTDIVKCAYSTKNFNIEDCKCRFDIFQEIEAVKPKVVYLFGSQAFTTTINIMNEKGFSFNPEYAPFEFLINKNQKRKISIGSFENFQDIKFIAVPQLGQNRFSLVGFENMLQLIESQIRPIVMSYL